ncbi:AAA family ATPase [Sphingomonas sp. PB2P12]
MLVGDVQQLGSVSAGRAFGQLQHAGMETPKLAEIVR